MPPELLTLSQAKADFDRDGFVVLRGFFSPAEAVAIQDHIERYVREVGPTLPPGDLMFEDKARPETLKQIARIAQHDDHFRQFLMQRRNLELAELLLDGPVVGKELEWFNKMPRDSRDTPAHQDGYYFMITPPSALTMWIALDEVDEENGCLRYVRGSHRLGLREHQRSKVLGFSQGIADYGADDIRNEVVVNARSGDVLIHHSLTIHMAHANRSQSRQRRSLGLIFYSAHSQQDVARYETYQRQLVDDWKTAGKF